MHGSDPIWQMAETLIVLASDNAWAAARAFGLDQALAGKPDQARHWRNIARAVLRRAAAAYASPDELSVIPEIAPAKTALTVRPPARPLMSLPAPFIDAKATISERTPSLDTTVIITIEPEFAAGPPIPMRARRQLAVALAAREAEIADLAKAA